MGGTKLLERSAVTAGSELLLAAPEMLFSREMRVHGTSPIPVLGGRSTRRRQNA
jgi:hypothetical protein